MAPLSATAMAAVPGSRAGMAGGAISSFRQLGYAFGIAVLGDVFRDGVQHSVSPDLASALSGGQAGAVVVHSPRLAPLVHQAFANGLDLTFLVAGGIGVAAGVLVFALVRPRPAEAMTPHGQESVTAVPAAGPRRPR
jgi:hypothetical protein